MTDPCRRPRTYAAALAAALASVLILAACGGEREPASPQAGPADSARASSSPAATSSAVPSNPATSAIPEPSPEDDGPVALDAGEFAAVVDAALDPTRGADLTIDSGLGILSGTGSIDFRQSPASLAVTLTSSETGDDQQITTRVIDDVLYLQDGGRFLAIGVDSPGNPFGASLSNQLDPRKMLAEVEAALVSARDRGAVERGGQELRAYRASAEGPALLDAIAPELAERPDTVVPDTVTCDLLVDADGRASQLVIDLGGDNGSLSYGLDNWRTDVAIQTPPPGQVDALDLPG